MMGKKKEERKKEEERALGEEFAHKNCS